jgi:CRP-like cAMP-binding protein
MNTKNAMTMLQHSEVFSSLDGSALDTLIFLSYTKQFAQDEAIYTKGDPSNDKFCLIMTGSANIVAKDGRIVKRVGSGEVIGEIALSDPHHKRTVTVTAVEPTEVLEWDVTHIKQEIPGLWKKLVKLAWEHLSEFYEE